LAELAALIMQESAGQRLPAANERRNLHATQREAERGAILERWENEKNRRPMTALTFMNALARVLPSNAAVVEEAVTTHQNLLERLGVLRDPTGHFAHRGWALGWGLGCALGVKLAWPERPVVGLLGDGSALYGIQGLWSAAHHRIPVPFVIANNAQYKILKVCGDVMHLPQMTRRNYLAMDLVGPEVDFVGLARAFGVEAHHVAEPDELSDRLQAALRGSKPLLLDVPVDRP
jgi:benzoylformate decarboxylase